METGTGTTDRTGLTDADRAALQSSLDEYFGEDGERAGLEFDSSPPHAARRGGRETGLVIDFNRARQHIEAARKMDLAADENPADAPKWRFLAKDFRGRARGAPPVRG